MTTIALLGCTHPHSRAHLETLRLSGRVDRLVLWDPDLASAEALARHAGPGPAEATADLARALGEEVGYVLACRRNDENPETVVAAARAGKHVLTEKPVARTAAELRPVLAEVEAAGVSLGVCYPWRAHPAAADLRAFREAGLLGRLLGSETRIATSRVRFRDPSHWLFTRRHGGGGILHWLGCHFFDLLRFILGEEAHRVSALAATLDSPVEVPVEVEDTAAVSIGWGSGALGTFSAGYHLARSRAGYAGATFDTLLAARGTEGRFAWHPTAPEEPVRLESAHPEWAGAPERERRYRLEPCEAYAGRHGLAFFERFLEDAAAGRPQLAGGEDALRVLEWVEAAYRSAETGQVVDLDRARG